MPKSVVSILQHMSSKMKLECLGTNPYTNKTRISNGSRLPCVGGRFVTETLQYKSKCFQNFVFALKEFNSVKKIQNRSMILCLAFCRCKYVKWMSAHLTVSWRIIIDFGLLLTIIDLNPFVPATNFEHLK